jgi:glycosyltransferase involved in cell wall biosynthesis
MRELFVISEMFITTGFGGIATNVLTKMKDTRMTALAVNCCEMSELRDALAYNILAYPANCDKDGDWMGFKRLPLLVERFQPKTVWASGDISPVFHWLKQIKMAMGDNFKPNDPRIVAYIAIDGEILMPKMFHSVLEAGVHIVTYTKYGIDMLARALHRIGVNIEQYDRQLSHIPLAVDTTIFHPAQDKKAVRKQLNEALQSEMVKDDSFVVNITNRNAPRKMIALSVYAAAEFAARHDDVRVIVRAAVDDWAGDFTPMVSFAGCPKDKFILAWPNLGGGHGVITQALAACYQASDVYLSASISEGHGLCEHEAAACGCALILPDNTVRPELWGGHARLMPCSAEVIIPPVCQTIGSVPSKDTIVRELEAAYADRANLKAEGEGCSRRASAISSWDAVASHMESKLWPQ